ncbi:MAG: hypothetical protein JW727_06890 [Candidatus Aenigmarchaeota archaeon]|nr:hypothetical protein [Candidatus Aenigmarchaeota archaeon]
MKTNINNIKIMKKSEFFKIIFNLFCILTGILFLGLILIYPYNAISYYFGKSLTNLILYILVLLIALFLLLRTNLEDFFRYLSKKRILRNIPNHWFIDTVLVMFIFFCIGLLFITSVLGGYELNLVLRNENQPNLIEGNINCTASGNIIFVGEKVYCKYSPTLYNTTSKVKFSYLNKSFETEIFSDQIAFIAPANVTSIEFRIEGYDSEGKFRKLIVSNSYNFLKPEEFEQSREKFIQYLIALLGVIFISVPSAMVNLKNLYYNENNKKRRK